MTIRTDFVINFEFLRLHLHVFEILNTNNSCFPTFCFYDNLFLSMNDLWNLLSMVDDPV